MAQCEYDTGQAVGSLPNCERSAVFEQAVQLALSRVIIHMDDTEVLNNSQGYSIVRPAPLTISGGVFGGPVGVTVSGSVVAFEETEFRSPVEIYSSVVAGTDTRHSAAIRVERSGLDLVRAVFEGGASVDADESIVSVTEVVWRELATPVLTSKGGTLSLRDVSIAATRGEDAVVDVDGTFVVVADTEACELRGPFLEGSCLPGAGCFVRRTQLSEGVRGQPLLSLDGVWTLTNTSLVGPEVPGTEVWGLSDRGYLDARTFGVHVWPGAGSGSPGIRGTVAPVPVLRPPTAYFEPPARFQCAAVVPDPEFLAFDAATIPGAYAPYPLPSAEDHYAAWWADGYGGSPYGEPGDADGIPAMWDCYPQDASIPLGPEVGANRIDEDCDGTLRCYVGADADGDGFPAWSEVPRANEQDLECADLPGREDPDDSDPCAIPGGTEPPGCGPDPHSGLEETGMPPTDTELPRQVVGIVGSSCAVAAGSSGPVWVALLALAARRRPARARAR